VGDILPKSMNLIRVEDMIEFIKGNVDEHEYALQKYVYNLGIVKVPCVHDYNMDTNVMKMEHLNVLNIADMYGEGSIDNDEDLEYLYDEIRTIVMKLYQNNVIYVDITPYNFVETTHGVYVIDFEHAKVVGNSEEYFNENIDKSEDIQFLYEFLFDEENKFNPNFR
jgi:tRNA A-37 threonylcarbamoyl transferase component Bud32